MALHDVEVSTYFDNLTEMQLFRCLDCHRSLESANHSDCPCFRLYVRDRFVFGWTEQDVVDL